MAEAVDKATHEIARLLKLDGVRLTATGQDPVFLAAQKGRAFFSLRVTEQTLIDLWWEVYEALKNGLFAAEFSVKHGARYVDETDENG